MVVEGIELEVDYNYKKGEDPVINYGDGSGYPGSGPTVEIHSVLYNGELVTELLDTFGGLDKIEARIIEIESP